MNKEKYNVTDKTWHNIADENNVWVKWRFEIIKKSMYKIGINFKENYQCLDVGCGFNNFALNFENISNYKIDQVDVDETLLRNKRRGRGTLFEYDINKRNDNLKNKYDIIFLLDVLEHIDNDGEFLQSCHFHLKKDGYLVINVPSMSFLFSKYDTAVGHLRRYNKKELMGLLLEKNFKIFSIQYWGFLLLPLLFLRKVLMNLSKKSNEDLIKKGMDTQAKPILFIINLLKYIELKFLKINFVGSSLILIVRK